MTEIQGASPPNMAPPSEASAEGADPAPPAWFAGHQRAVAARLDSIEKSYTDRLEKFRAKYLEVSKAPAEPAPVSKDDLAAAMKLGGAVALLPASAQESVLAAVDAHGYAVALSMAETIAEAVKASTPTSSAEPAARAAPRGVGASPAPVAPVVATMAEYRAIKKADPAKARELLAKGLDLTKLPPR